MGRATSKGNKAKSKMKQPSDMPTPRFEHGGSDLWSNTLLLDQGGTLGFCQQRVVYFIYSNTHTFMEMHIRNSDLNFHNCIFISSQEKQYQH